MKSAIAVLIWVLGTALAIGDSPVYQYAKAVSCPNGEYFMLVTPVDANRRTWIWTVYKMQDVGAFKEAWSSEGTYSTHMYLSDDGMSVACVESRPYGHSPKDDVVVAVFRRGKLLKAYRPQDVIQSIEAIIHSSSHYRWLANESRPVLEGRYLTFETIEGEKYAVDVESGALKRSER